MAGDPLAPVVEHLGGDRLQQHRLAALEAALAARERQQRIDHALLLLADREHALTGGAQRRGAGGWVGERHLEDRALERERRAQLVRGVRDELALSLE